MSDSSTATDVPRSASVRAAGRAAEPAILFAATVLVFIAMGISPRDRLIWLAESVPVALIFAALASTHRRFPLTPLAHRLLFTGAVMVLIGAHYTYAGVPVSRWAQHTFDLDRSYYDRVGHVMLGVVFMILWRELYARLTPMSDRPRVLSLAAALSAVACGATYEIMEWRAALWLRGRADAFLAMQGDPWDAQADMACAWIGAILAMLLFQRVHDRHLRAIRQS